ncbi:hypothetical protein [Paraburkholderia humisilvae]|uniref:Uncharacterized protein n=1 Tax=Paraburkholderia humisilvae TaxID=627669 RepID=A0A6J5FC22_9BURK|nr:hypothetical protein LMG29542_08664 [Paraburkholderia humisilvae]
MTGNDLLNDRGVPFFGGSGIPYSRALTDRGTESSLNNSASPVQRSFEAEMVL